jgi:pilus assembly protein Flp/PilA
MRIFKQSNFTKSRHASESRDVDRHGSTGRRPRVPHLFDVSRASFGCRSLRSALHSDACGATAIEYGLIACLIAVACIIAFQTLGLNLVNIFTTISNALV